MTVELLGSLSEFLLTPLCLPLATFRPLGFAKLLLGLVNHSYSLLLSISRLKFEMTGMIIALLGCVQYAV
jgi:hypothetical protein